MTTGVSAGNYRLGLVKRLLETCRQTVKLTLSVVEWTGNGGLLDIRWDCEKGNTWSLVGHRVSVLPRRLPLFKESNPN